MGVGLGSGTTLSFGNVCHPFPKNCRHMLEYVEVRVKGNAAVTTFAASLRSLQFLEEAGEVPTAERISLETALASAIKEAETRTRANLSTEGLGRGRQQAPPLPLYLVAVLEKVVVDEERPGFQRAYAWYRCVRHWAGMRFDDTAGLAPSSLTMRARGLFGLLKSTKTSGPDKRISALPIYVSEEAYVDTPWLEIGFGI